MRIRTILAVLLVLFVVALMMTGFAPDIWLYATLPCIGILVHQWFEVDEHGAQTLPPAPQRPPPATQASPPADSRKAAPAEPAPPAEATFADGQVDERRADRPKEVSGGKTS